MDARREVNRKLKIAHWKYVCNLFEQNVEEVDRQPCLKRFWTYVKHQRSSSCGVSPLKSEGKLITSPKEKAEVLNNQFLKSFSRGEEYTEEEFNQKCTMEENLFEEIMPDIDITIAGIEKQLKGLNANKATGPDGLSPRVLKELSSEIAPILTIIYRASLRTGIVPSDWRTALVNGFWRGRSCETQLLEFVEEVSSGLDSGTGTDVVVMDFAKAFDRVNHSLLTHKLSRYGIQNNINK